MAAHRSRGGFFCARNHLLTRREACAGHPGDNTVLGRAGRELLKELAGLLCVSMLFRLGDSEKRS